MVPSILISVIVTVFIGLEGCLACFRNDEYKSTVVATGSSFYQECHCSEPGYSVANLTWVNTNNQIIVGNLDSRIYLEKQSDSLNIHIPKMSKSMAGAYKCRTTFQGQEYVQIHTIEVYDPLYFFNADELQFVKEAHDSQITCEARSEFPILITWHKIEENSLFEIKNQNDKYLITPVGLIVKNVTKEDGGTYRCTAIVLSTGEEVDRFIKVQVLTLPTIEDVIAIPGTTVSIGDKLSIECIAESSPDPLVYEWTKLNTTDPNDNMNQTWEQISNTLIFESVKAGDEGYYQCNAISLAGNTTSGVQIEVQAPAEIIKFDNITAEAGTTVKIDCEVFGIPEPNVTITKKTDGEEIIEIPMGWTFKVERYHKGSYYCNAANEVSNDTKEMYFKVLHKPYFEKNIENIWGWNGKTINMNCSHESEPKSEIKWTFPNNVILTTEQIEANIKLLEILNYSDEDVPVNIDNSFAYGVYECFAKNEYGEAVKMIEVKEGFVPSLIYNATLIQQAATSVTFSIEGLLYPFLGPDVIGFTAEYDEADNYNITHIHLNRTWALDRPLKLEKLRPNTTYYIKFAAINEVGVGSWCDLLMFETLEKSVPEPPVLDTDYIELESSDNVLKWKAPADNGDTIDYYAVRYCPLDDDVEEKLCKEEVTKDNTELDLSKLELNTTYVVEIIAHNSLGNSTPANVTLITAALSSNQSQGLLSAGVIIGIAVVVVIICIVLLDVILCVWRKQGIIATCCTKKNKDENFKSRDEKGLLRDNGDLEDKTQNKGHKEYEYNKTTGIITGKHSSV